MASPLQGPQIGHSLWLQNRSSRRVAQRTGWRSDLTPIGLVLLLLGLLILLSVFLPGNEAVERVKQLAGDEKGASQHSAVVGVLAEP